MERIYRPGMPGHAKTYRINSGEARTKPFEAGSPEDAISWAYEHTLFRNSRGALMSWLQVFENGTWVYVQ